MISKHTHSSQESCHVYRVTGAATKDTLLDRHQHVPRIQSNRSRHQGLPLLDRHQKISNTHTQAKSRAPYTRVTGAATKDPPTIDRHQKISNTHVPRIQSNSGAATKDHPTRSTSKGESLTHTQARDTWPVYRVTGGAATKRTPPTLLDRHQKDLSNTHTQAKTRATWIQS
ncbi:hypothetical protein RRG08_036869 [Elysia crispata]|uniref:Uncharacterized protein n=1 Tax=Elysia crispata TaxID=231223 RepID=A0AAE0YAI0_9GAST|nr:hypothetical protein RRG08_036869 [Elysia crispata]